MLFNIIKFILFLILLQLALIFISALTRKHIISTEQKLCNNHFEIRPSILFFITGITGFICLNGFTILMYVFQNETSSIWIAVLFETISLWAVFLLIHFLSYRILFLEDKIIEFKLFSKKVIQISSLTSAKIIGNKESMDYELKLYIEDKRVLSISDLYIGYNLAMERIKNIDIRIIEQSHNNSFKDFIN